MSFDLRISFTGLCLFVPDTSAADPALRGMHVVLPAFGEMEHEHFVRLIFDQAYGTKGAAQLARKVNCVPLAGIMELFVPNPDPLKPPLPVQGLLNPTLPEEVVDLDPIMGRKLDRAYVGNDPGERVTARVMLRAGVVSDYEVGAHFVLGTSHPQRMTWQVEWTIRGISADRILLRFTPFGTTLQETPPLPSQLFPVGDTIRLSVFNATCADLPPQTARTTEVPRHLEVTHFAAYYNLYGVNPPLPRVHGFEPPEADCGCQKPVVDIDDLERASRHPRAGGDAEASRSLGGAERVTVGGGLLPVLQGGLGGRPFTCTNARATLAD